jgi:hypothetical protein
MLQDVDLVEDDVGRRQGDRDRIEVRAVHVRTDRRHGGALSRLEVRQQRRGRCLGAICSVRTPQRRHRTRRCR